MKVALATSTTPAATGRRSRGTVTPCGLRLDGVVKANTGFDNTSSERSRVARSSRAAWVTINELEYSTTDFTLNLLSYILFVVVLSCSFGPKRTKRPGTAKTVATAFCSCRHGEHSAGSCFSQTTFRSAIGDKRTRFPRNNSNADIHRSNSFYPVSAV